ncbi:MAG: single-stranded DNA-binding protein [Candidatus Tectomicrobia bacterium]|nr:single-stranded DNA-binding protein [Candidatus Tectomicrobia bacterium]
MSLNSVNLLGYLTRDVEVRYTPTGNPVANFGMALNRRYRQDEEVKEETTFVDLVAFNRTAEIANEFLGKGRPVAIEGRLRYRTWEDQGGAKRSKLEVVVNQLHLMPRNGSNGNNAETPVDESSEEIPF